MLDKLKEKAVKMTNMRKYLVLGVALAFALVTGLAFAQDDLDDLLKDLEAETAKPAAASSPATAAPAVAAESSAGETPPPQAEVKAEEPAPAEAAESSAGETPPPQAEAAESSAGETPPPQTEVKAEESAPAKAEAPAAEEEPAEAPAPVIETAQLSNQDAELIANIRTTEKLRREALDVQAKREIAEARQAMKDEEYGEAVRHYGLALKFLNDRPSSKDFRKECDQGIAEGLYRAALQEDDLGRREKAIKLMEKAIDMRHPKARRVLGKWNAEGEKADERADLSEIKHRLNDEDYKMSREQIRKHLKRSRQFLAVKDMKKALEECEILLVNDP